MVMTCTPSRLTINVATQAARQLVEAMSPAAERISIAGSVRRSRDTFVSDIEIVIAPTRSHDLFGDEAEPKNLLAVLGTILDDGLLVDQPWYKQRCRGEKYKTYGVDRSLTRGCGIDLDLFVVTTDTYGLQLALRTGPLSFSRRLVTQRCEGGLLPDGYKVRGGVAWFGRAEDQRGNPINFGTPKTFADEREFITWCCGRWIDPMDRE